MTAGLDRWPPATTAYTISLDTPGRRWPRPRAKAADRPILKIKLGGAGRRSSSGSRPSAGPRPDATLIADANEGWTRERPRGASRRLRRGRLRPRRAAPAGGRGRRPRADLAAASRSAPTRACTTAPSLDRLVGLYDAVNIKLDKTGGLTEALALADAAEARGFALMIGCMVGTSLAMAPAMLLAPRARFVDLDGPLLLARDREPGLRYEGSLVYPPAPALWG